MKKIFFAIVLIVFAFSSCKKHCYTCSNTTGDEIREKCFKSEDDRYAYMAAEIGKPDAERCQ